MFAKVIRSQGIAMTFLLLTVAAPRAMAQGDTAAILSVDFNGASIDTFFDYIKNTTGFRAIYGSALTRDLAPITYQGDRVPLFRILDTVLGRLGLGYSFNKHFIRLYKNDQQTNPYLTPGILHGKVMDESGEPLGGVSVINKMGNLYALTSQEGIFKLTWPPGSSNVAFTYRSYAERSIRVTNAATFQNVVLKPLPNNLDAVVVMAYHKTSRRNNTASADKVAGTELRGAGSNAIKALSGRVPGLVITESSGAPGSSVRVQIRGRQSIGTIPGIDNQPLNDPLLLLNKVPQITGNRQATLLPSAAGDPQQGGSAAGGISAQAAINPEDIESIDVLKDADATAIYGSRGAHGAILITTQQGRMGKPRFNAKMEKGKVFSTKIPVLLNNRQYTGMRKEAIAAANAQPNATNAPDLVLLDTNDYQNIPELLIGGSGDLTNINLSLNGGDTLLRYFFSSGLYREGSVLPADLSQQRLSLYGNLQYRSPNRRFQSGLSLHYSNLLYKSIAADPMFSTRLVPLLPRLRNDAGKLEWQKNGFQFVNPLGQMFNINSTRMNTFTGNLQVEYELWNNLWLRTNLGYQSLPVKEQLIFPIEGHNPLQNPTGEMSRASNQYEGWIIEPQLGYSYTRNGKLISALIGATLQQERNDWYTFQGSGYPNDAVLGLPGADTQMVEDHGASVYRYHGVYGRANLDWRKKYFINATGRLDGSSRFGFERRMSLFGALGAAWIFSQEKWVEQELSFLSHGKLRASYGSTGNDNIGDYGYLETWVRQNELLPYDGTGALDPDRPANPALGWEKNRKAEIALELEFKELVFFNASFYRNITSDQLVSVKLPAQAGLTGPFIINSPARVLNTGWEFTLRSTHTWRKHNSWTSTFLLTLPRNRLLSFPGMENTAYYGTLLVGSPLSQQQGYLFQGINQTSGLFEVPDVPELVMAGHREVKYYASWFNEFKLGQFCLSVFLEAREQQATDPLYYVYGETIPGRWTRTQLSNQPVTVLDRWQQPDDQALLQRWTTANNPAVSKAVQFFRQTSLMMTNASFLRVRSVQLYWDLPSPWAQWLKLSAARVYLQGQNLWTITDYDDGDPTLHAPLKLPSLRMITAGLQINL